MGYREEKRRVRMDIHKALAVPALYLVAGQAPVPVTVRLSYRHGETGANGPLAPAVRADVLPKVTFLCRDVELPARGAIVSVGPGEAYRIDKSEYPNDITITATAIIMKPGETAGLPVPE